MEIGAVVTATGVPAQVQTAIGAASTLLAGCVSSLKNIKEYGPVMQNLKAAKQSSKTTLLSDSTIFSPD
jgi:hypothetical protein